LFLLQASTHSWRNSSAAGLKMRIRWLDEEKCSLPALLMIAYFDEVLA